MLCYLKSQEFVLDNFILNFANSPKVQALGLNCSEGPSGLLNLLKTLVNCTDKFANLALF